MRLSWWKPLALGLAVALAVGAPARAVVYYRFVPSTGGGTQIWQMNDDGSGKALVLQGLPTPVPYWVQGYDPSHTAPSGQRLFLTNDPIFSTPCEITFVVPNPDRTPQYHHLTNFGANGPYVLIRGQQPVWSKDDSFFAMTVTDLVNNVQVLCRVKISVADVVTALTAPGGFEANFTPITGLNDPRIDHLVAVPYDSTLSNDFICDFSPEGDRVAFVHAWWSAPGQNTQTVRVRTIGPPGTTLADLDPTHDRALWTGGWYPRWRPAAGSNLILIYASSSAASSQFTAGDYFIDVTTGQMTFYSKSGSVDLSSFQWYPNGSSLAYRYDNQSGHYIARFAVTNGNKGTILTSGQNVTQAKYPIGCR